MRRLKFYKHLEQACTGKDESEEVREVFHTATDSDFGSFDYLVKKRQEVLDTLDLLHQNPPQLFNLTLGNVLDED